MAGGDLQRYDGLRLHVPEEVHEVAAGALTKWFDSSALQIQGTSALAGLALPVTPRLGQELDLGRGRGVALEEFGPFGHERGAGRRRLGLLVKDGWEIDAWGHEVDLYFVTG